MSTLHETDSAEHVFIQGIKTITRVLVDDEVGDLAKAPLQAVDHHEDTVLALKKSQRASSLAAAYVNRAQMRTERELGLYCQRRALSLSTHRKKGEKTPEYHYLFRGKTAATLLPTDDLHRREELDALVDRAGNVEAAGPTALAELGALGDAIKAEKHAMRECQRANKATEEAARVEKNARIAVVVCIRAMNKGVQSFFAADPAMARRLLGHGNAVATRRRNARLAAEAEAAKAAEEEAAAAKAASDAAIEDAVAKAVEPKAAARLAIVPMSAEAASVPGATPQSVGGNGATGTQLAGALPPATLPQKTPPAN